MLKLGGKQIKYGDFIGEKDLICKLYLETKTNPLFNNTPEAEYKCLLWLDGLRYCAKAL